MEGGPRVVFLRHAGSHFDEMVIGRCLGAETNLVGEIRIKSDRTRKLDTLKYEYRRSGLVGLLDALAYRAYYHFVLADDENEKIDALVEEFRERYPSPDVPSYSVEDPNDAETVSILERLDADVMIARTKVLLDEAVFSTPTYGTLVIHPGICPEYRNQHGCFWALANGEPNRVGYSLIQIDEGIDTGDILAQNGTTFAPVADEHSYIQLKAVADNLSEITRVISNVATTEQISTDGRESAMWGMPKLSAWRTWKRRAQRFDRDEYDSSDAY